MKAPGRSLSWVRAKGPAEERTAWTMADSVTLADGESAGR